MRGSSAIVVLSVLMLSSAPAAAEPEPAPAAPVATIQAPHWLRRPHGEDMARTYPRKARGANGGATLRCLIDARGQLTGCAVLREDPPDLGFGEAALKLAPLFKMKPVTDDGRPVEGGVVMIPIRWTIAG